jgi:hypothetical protein
MRHSRLLVDSLLHAYCTWPKVGQLADFGTR